MIEPTAFGKYLKEKRIAAKLTQGELAAVINKTGQYISNIEKGKNNAPPKDVDLEALIVKLALTEEEQKLFLEKAAADRDRLPTKLMDYLVNHENLMKILKYGLKNEVNDCRWAEILEFVTKLY